MKNAPPSSPAPVSLSDHSANSTGSTGVMVMNAEVLRTSETQLSVTRRPKRIG